MNQHRPVPRLDLAPKLKRPLSLWNPLDYLRLLYWVFFFPQALRCYLDTFGNKFIPAGEITWRKGWHWLCRSRIERQLILQGLALTVFTLLALGVILQRIGVSFDGFFTLISILMFSVMAGFLGVWGVTHKYGMTWGLASGIASGVTFGIAFVALGSVLVLSGVVSGVSSSAAWSVAVFLGSHIASILAKSVEFGILFGVAFGISRSATLGLVSGVAFGVWLTPLLGVSFGMLIAMFSGIGFDWEFGMASGVGFGLAFSVASSLGILRLENWLFCLPVALLSRWNRPSLLPCVTPLPLPYLSSWLTRCLRQDWETGINNANQLLAYTLQFIPVVKAINRVLAEISPELIILRIAQLSESTDDLRLVRFISEKLNLGTDNVFKPRFDTPARATAAGFWYLQYPIRETLFAGKIIPNPYDQNLQKALEAFAVVGSLPHAEEIFLLTQALAIFNEASDLAAIAFVQVPTLPQKPLLRPATWETISRLHRVVQEAQILLRSLSHSARAFALSRALGELTNILDEANTLPKAEQWRIVYIAQIWRQAFLQVAGEVGKISIAERVRNPYVVGDPVEGNLFVGRDDVMKQLEAQWILSHQLQSVVIFGHRRMGKTSILLNASKRLGSEVQIAYVNLLLLGDSPQGVGEVLMAITDAISDAVGCTPPDDTDLLNLPYRTFERYLKHVVETCHGTSLQGLIVALDEFEKIEELIEAEKIPKDFMGYLRGLVQMSSKVAFAFAGLHLTG